MPIAITDEQRALADSIRAWAAREHPVELVRALEDGGDAAALLPGLATIGLFTVAVPERLGGAGASLADAAAGVERAAAELAPGPVASAVLAGWLLGGCAENSTVKELVTGLADGTARVTVVLPRSPLTADPLTADLGPVADVDDRTHLILPVGDGWWVVPPGTAGLDVRTVRSLDFSRALAHVTLTGVTAVHRLTGVGEGHVRTAATALAAAEAAGVADWCLRTATEYARVREQFGRPIGSFQAVKHLCAEMLCRAEVAAAVAWDAARAADGDPGPAELAAATAAATALDAAVGNAKDCVQVLGGIGFTWEHDAHLYLRRALAVRQLAGGSARWRRRTAELALAGVRRELGVRVEPDPAVRATVDRIAEAPPERRRALLAESGYLAPHWPSPHGLDASPELQLAIDAELGRAGISRPDLVIGGWAVPTILGHGTEAQRDRFVGPTLRGEITWCQLFSEPEAGSDLAALRTEAVRGDGGWLLSGQKVWTSLATEADWAICLARTDPDAPKHRGITYFLVDMGSPGITVRPLREITGVARFNEVFLDRVFVPDDLVVGEVNGGWALARTTLANERVAMGGGSSVGEGVQALLDAVRAAGLDGDPLVLDRVGALVAEGAAGTLLDLRTALRRLAGQQPGAESSVRKLVGVRHRQDLAETALELCGPDGVGESAADLQHELLLTRCLSIAGGTTQVLLNVAAERILGLPRG
ncbi:acyl-CoA dehydrogenase [Amycolatopsis suaedae]|uniref:Acyl-CoA dehydrogenase n=1 Tax=Amycolatopsis suaedae TaxID=2510978 RepID=A0A4V2ELY2_9PSEU|nr:acyl-CoA dehydrogenase [Amycolatopsis suaedae]RZQ63155.1 acyl-CoA dehydrogenase [Amycolatopsis suaedae]